MIFQDELELAEHFKLTMADIRELLGKGFWSIIPDPADPGFEAIEVSPEQAARLRRHASYKLRQRGEQQQAAERASRAKEMEAEIERRLTERRREQVAAMYRHGPIRRPRTERPEPRGN